MDTQIYRSNRNGFHEIGPRETGTSSPPSLGRTITRVQPAADLMGSPIGHLIVTFDSPVRLALHEADELDGDYVIDLRPSRIHNTSGAILHSVVRLRPFLFRGVTRRKIMVFLVA